MRILLLTLLLFSPDALTKTLTFSTLDRGSSLRDEISESIIREAYRRLDYDVKIVYLPGKRSLIFSNSGEIDGELRRGILTSQTYKNLVAVPLPIRVLKICALIREGQQLAIDKSLISGSYVGIVGGGQLSKKVAKLAKDYMEVSSINQLFELLAVQRINIGVANCEILEKHRRQHTTKRFQVTPIEFAQRKLYHFLHKKHKKLLPKVHDVLKKMKQDGSFEQLSTAKPASLDH